MNIPERLTDLAESAIRACRCRPLIREHLDRNLDNPLILSIGKSALSMAWGAHDLYPDSPLHLFTSSSYMGDDTPVGAHLYPGEHPVPGEGSFSSGRALKSLVMHSEAPILLFLSGGGSSLVDDPLSPDVDEALIRDLAHLLLSSDFSYRGD